MKPIIQPYRSWQIRRKILFPFLALTMVGVALGALLFERWSAAVIDHWKTEEITVAAESVARELTGRERDYIRFADAAAGGDLGEALARRDQTLAVQYLLPFKLGFELEMVTVYDPLGRGFVALGMDEKPRDLQPLFRRALTGVSTSGFVAGPDYLELWGAAPVKSDQGIVGVVLVGQRISGDFLLRHKSEAEQQIAIIFNRRVMVATDPYVYDLPFPVAGGKPRLFELPGRDQNQPARVMYRDLPLASGQPALLAVIEEMTDVLRDVAWMRFLLVAGTLGLFTGMTLVSMAIARSITRPLSEIVVATERLSRGDFRARLPVRTDDELARLATAMNTMAQTIQDQVRRLTESYRQIKLQMDQVGEMYSDTIRSLVMAVEAKDPYTSGHSENVARYARLIGKELNLPDETVELISQAARLHDIGKIGVADSVLNKRGKLLTFEKAQIVKHPIIGAEILSQAESLGPVVPLVKHHH